MTLLPVTVGRADDGTASYPSTSASTRQRRQRHLSVRRSIVFVLALTAAIATAQLALNLRAFSQAAYLLTRAEISYRQLAAYQELSVAALEYIVVPVEAKRRAIGDGLTTIERLTAFEAGLVKDNGGDESNIPERDRLTKLGAAIGKMLAADPPGVARAPTLSAAYAEALKPLMTDAIAGERNEIHLVEQSMQELQRHMGGFGILGVLIQSLMISSVLLLITRSVLQPMALLVADIKEFGRGSLAHRVAITRHNEFGLLAQHINRMARHLERGRAFLVGNNERLETIVTERTRALQDRNDDLREIDESRRRFFADVSHELRTPLTAIVGEADVTLRCAETEVAPYRDALASIRANSGFLNRRIDDLMALARSSDGRLELHTEMLDLNLIAGEAVAEIRSLAKIYLVMTELVPANAPMPVRGDRTKLRQCLMILLDNAVKFSRPYQTVTVALRSEAGSAVLSVIDHGRGIAIKELPRVFERFYQTEIGKRMGGTGLGLAIARRIVEAHAGTITIEANDAGGTIVTITHPIAESSET